MGLSPAGDLLRHCDVYLKILPLDGGGLRHLSTDFYIALVGRATWEHLCLQEVNEFKEC